MMVGPDYKSPKRFSVSYWGQNINKNILIVKEEIVAHEFGVNDGAIKFYLWSHGRQQLIAAFNDWVSVIEIPPE